MLFDFRGCGNNLSEYVTLGLRESHDLYCIVREVYKRYELESLGFWGRSMGAVTIIHYLHTIESKSIFYKNEEEKLVKKNSKSKNNGNLKKNLKGGKLKFNEENKMKNNQDKIVADKEKIISKEIEKNKKENNSNIKKEDKKNNTKTPTTDSNLEKQLTEKRIIEKKLSEHIKKEEKKILKNARRNSIQKIKKTSKNEYLYISNLKNIIKCIVLDSPFTDSYKMIKGILKNQSKISNIVAKMMLFPVRRSIKNSVGYDVLGLNKPEKKVELINFPGIFLIGELDELINKVDFKKMFDEYQGFLNSG